MACPFIRQHAEEHKIKYELAFFERKLYNEGKGVHPGCIRSDYKFENLDERVAKLRYG